MVSPTTITCSPQEPNLNSILIMLIALCCPHADSHTVTELVCTCLWFERGMAGAAGPSPLIVHSHATRPCFLSPWGLPSAPDNPPSCCFWMQSDPEVIRMVAERYGIMDMSLLVADPWSIHALPLGRERRVLQAFLYTRSWCVKKTILTLCTG